MSEPDELLIIDRWLRKKLDELSKPMEQHLLRGGSLNDPEYRQQLGQHQAFMRVRSFISGARR